MQYPCQSACGSENFYIIGRLFRKVGRLLRMVPIYLWIRKNCTTFAADLDPNNII